MAWDLTAVSAVLNQIYAHRIADQLNQHTALLSLFPKTLGEGKNIAWDAKVARGTSAGSYASGADITGNDNDTEVPATLNRKRLKAEFKVAGDALATAARSGPDAYANLFGKAINDAVVNLGASFGSQIYGDGTGNTNLDLDGLGIIVANTGTYANVSRVTYSTWQAQVLANGGTPRALTIALMRQMERLIFIASGMMPDVIVTTPAIYETYEALFDAYKRANTPEIQQKGDLGIASLAFKGIPIIRDIYCPAGKMYFLRSSNCLEFEQIPPVTEAEGIELVQGYKPIVNADGNLGLQVAIEMLGKTGDAYKGFVKLYGNLKCERPNACGVIADIA